MKRWYVVQVYTGYEDIVKRDLGMRFQEESLEELLGDIIVPTSEAMERFALGEATSKKEKIFPGYLLIQMEMIGETQRLVLSTPRVSRFLGGMSPMPLSETEVERIFSQMSGKVAIASEAISFVAGNEVHITNGPFSGFVGIVEEIDEEHGRLKVMVSIFGRLTPIELGVDDVKR